MSKIFPNARDYRTVTLRITEEQRRSIEKTLGFELLPGQRDQFQYFEMVGEGNTKVGTLIAASQKGELGAIEFVLGLDDKLTIKDLYIQRARERDQSFKGRAFLDVFKGVKVHEAHELGKRYAGPSTPGSTAVIKGLIKELVTFRMLVKGGQ